VTRGDGRIPADSGRIDPMSTDPSTTAGGTDPGGTDPGGTDPGGTDPGGTPAPAGPGLPSTHVAEPSAAALPDEADGPGPGASPPARPITMAEYDEAMAPRGQMARARGLAAPYIPGGRDPNPEATARAERRYIQLLILMVAVIVGGGFIITIVGLIVTGGK
jgi:hypothetical protein